MKRFNAHAVDMRSVDFIVTADSKKKAAKKVNSILENTDIIDSIDGERSVAFQLFETEDEDEKVFCRDKEHCSFCGDDECLPDELY